MVPVTTKWLLSDWTYEYVCVCVYVRIWPWCWNVQVCAGFNRPPVGQFYGPKLRIPSKDIRPSVEHFWQGSSENLLNDVLPSTELKVRLLAHLCYEFLSNHNVIYSVKYKFYRIIWLAARRGLPAQQSLSHTKASVQSFREGNLYFAWISCYFDACYTS